jgi:hypothetical protein
MLGGCGTNNPNEIAKWVGELTYSPTVADVEGTTIQGCASSLKCTPCSVERRDAPIGNLARTPSRDLSIGNVETQLRGTDSDARKVLIDELRTLPKDTSVPLRRWADGWDEHENVFERLEHPADA